MLHDDNAPTLPTLPALAIPRALESPPRALSTPPAGLPFDRRVALHTAPPRPPGRWLVLCDRGPIGHQISAALRDRGEEVIRIARFDASRPSHRQDPAEVVMCPEASGELEALVEAADTPDRPLVGVLHLWLLDPLPSAEPASAARPLEDLARRSGLLALTAALDRAALAGSALDRAARTAHDRTRPRLWLVTRGALPADAGQPAPDQRLLWSLGRVLGVAHPELEPTLVELDPARPIGEGAAALMRVVTAASRHRRLATRRQCWFAPSPTAEVRAA